MAALGTCTATCAGVLHRPTQEVTHPKAVLPTTVNVMRPNCFQMSTSCPASALSLSSSTSLSADWAMSWL